MGYICGSWGNSNNLIYFECSKLVRVMPYLSDEEQRQWYRHRATSSITEDSKIGEPAGAQSPKHNGPQNYHRPQLPDCLTTLQGKFLFFLFFYIYSQSHSDRFQAFLLSSTIRPSHRFMIVVNDILIIDEINWLTSG